MSKFLSWFLVVTVALGTLLFLGIAGANAADNPFSTVKANAFDDHLRDLWVSHIVTVREVVLANIYKDEKAAVASDRVASKSVAALGNALEPYYGEKAAEKFTSLLTEHYTAIKQYLMASLKGDRGEMESAKTAASKNLDAIAEYLHSLNPYISSKELDGLLDNHLGHHLIQIDALRTDRASSEAHDWAGMKTYAYAIADLMARNIIKQFPKKFEDSVTR